MELQLKIASAGELELLKKKVSEILEKRGLRVDHPEMLALAKKRGAVVHEDSGYVKFPARLQSELIANMEKEFTLAGQSEEKDLKIPHPEGLFYPGSVTGCMHIHEAEGGRRKIQVTDLDEIFQLVDAMEHVNYYSIVTYDAKELPQETTDINCLYHALGNCGKFGWIQPFDGPNAKYLLEMASVVVGGKENLAKRPILSPFSCVTEPFVVKHMDAEVIMANAEYGVPVFCCAMPTAGANAPITPAGTALVTIAEVMGLILLVQCVKPGLPCIAVCEQLMLDMKSTFTLQSSIQISAGRILNAQFFQDGYGIPAHTFGAGTDAFTPGPQAVADVMSSSMTAALGGNLFLQDAGQVECCKAYSPLQLIVDNEIFGMVKTLKKGMSITEESMGFEEVLGIGEQVNFMANPHTFKHFREIFEPSLFNTRSRTKWEADGQPDLYDRALETYRKFKSDFKPKRLSDDVDAELRKIVAHANKTLGG